ncbi:hypothetical protein LSAT2_018854 [Lamellibrachia satsuma]|nr:hypothetical protein LSAT2_018854 [Lamellibrachia satsuma]
MRLTRNEDFTPRQPLKWTPDALQAMNANYTCNSTIRKDSAFVASHENALYYAINGIKLRKDLHEYYYPGGVHCQLTIRMAPRNSHWQILIQFIGPVYLAVTHNSRDTLTIYRGRPVEGDLVRSISGDQVSVPPVIINASDVTLKFDSSCELRRASGFQILYNIFRLVENGECSPNEFLCDSNRCLPREFMCDEADHCVDGTDEECENVQENNDYQRHDRVIRLYIIVVAANVVATVGVVGIFVCCYRKKKKQLRAKIRKAMVATLDAGATSA